MVEVFKTNVFRKKEASQILGELKDQFPDLQANFDLKDCDKILRVEGGEMESDFIRRLMEGKGYTCEVLS